MSPALQRDFSKMVQYLKETQNLFGVDIGYRVEDGELADSFVVRVHVENLALETFLRKQFSDKYFQFIRGGFRQALLSIHAKVSDPVRTQRRNPIQPGISIGSFESGTLGLMCRDNVHGGLGFLTCYHVIAGWAGIAVTQPGPGADGGNFSMDKIGQLERFVPYDLRVDAAFVKLNGKRGVVTEQFASGILVKTVSPMAVEKSVTLQKSGRTTGVTTGRITAQGFYPIEYPGFGRKLIAGFQIDSIDGQRTSDGGDSGAVWYDSQTHEGKGLHFASGTGQNALSSLACQLPDVLNFLKISPI